MINQEMALIILLILGLSLAHNLGQAVLIHQLKRLEKSQWKYIQLLEGEESRYRRLLNMENYKRFWEGYDVGYFRAEKGLGYAIRSKK